MLKMVRTVKIGLSFLVPESKVRRRLYMIGILIWAAAMLYAEGSLIYGSYKHYCDPAGDYADWSMGSVSWEQDRYGSISMLSLHDQDDWQAFVDVSAGDLIDVITYYYNENSAEPQEALMAIELPASLYYVQGSASFQLPGDTEWRQFGDQFEADSLFESHIDFGSCPPGERIGVRFTVEMNLQEISNSRDTIASIHCHAAPGKGISAACGLVGIRHRTVKRVSNFYYWCIDQFIQHPVICCGIFIGAIIVIVYTVMYWSCCINEERNERNEET